jgi:hypothetical protein
MNKVLINKLLSKLSLKDLYDEIKGNERLVCALGMILATKRPTLFAQLIRNYIEDLIKVGDVVNDINDDDKNFESFLKTEIISMDGSEQVSVNKTIKKAAVKSSTDTCSGSSSGFRSTC